MNNIADVIPVLLLLSAGFALVLGLGLTSFELIAARLSGDKGYQPIRQAALPRHAGLTLVQQQEPANSGDFKAAA